MALDMFLAWLSARPVSAKRLHHCRVRGGHAKGWRASVFPFFEAGGAVRAMLCVRYDQPGLYVAPYRDGLIEVGPPFLPRQFILRIEDFEPLVAGERLAHLARLWHYDPWWVLTLPAFADHPATRALKATNCVSHLPHSPKSLLFEPGLGRVHALTVSEGDRVVTLPWRHGWLASAPRKRSPGTWTNTRRRWVLDPVWARGGD